MVSCYSPDVFQLCAELEETLRCVQTGREGERVSGRKPESDKHSEYNNKETRAEENMLRKGMLEREQNRLSETNSTSRLSSSVDVNVQYSVCEREMTCIEVNLLLGHICTPTSLIFLLCLSYSPRSTSNHFPL